MNDLDKARIREICEQRGISELVHFTRIENLRSIFQIGLKPRSQLQEIEYYYNDQIRLDGQFDAVSLSISFPNWRMFYKYSANNQRDWAVLSIRPNVLWEYKCAFMPTNASNKNLRGVMSIYPSSFMNADAFEKMFAEPRNPCLPPNYTTDPQAEVLVYGEISREYFQRVYLYSWEKIVSIRLSFKDDWWKSIELKDDRSYFKPRCDF